VRAPRDALCAPKRRAAPIVVGRHGGDDVVPIRVPRFVLDHAPTLGAVCGIAAAALFGLSAPFSKILLPGNQPVVLAGLLYAGAAITLSLARLVRGRRAKGSEARLRVADVPLLLVVTATGGVIGPVLMLLGLRRVSGVAGSLLLNLEAPFTMVVAVLLFGEHMSSRGTRAATLIVGGGLALAWSAGGLSADLLGTAALAGACLSWAVDNNLTQRLSLRDPVAIVQIKSGGAAVGNLVLAVALGDAHLPGATVLIGALLLGAFSYGTSILLDVYALRLAGAAREAAYFATAPFFGAVVAVPLLGERIGPEEGIAAVLMALGVGLLLREGHEHHHAHLPLVHEHVHAHDEHHQHAHDEHIAPEAVHSHRHEHSPLEHSHPHVSDAHHRHPH
jgi:drug/metabolite transporter (DMT)-like permease